VVGTVVAAGPLSNVGGDAVVGAGVPAVDAAALEVGAVELEATVVGAVEVLVDASVVEVSVVEVSADVFGEVGPVDATSVPEPSPPTFMTTPPIATTPSSPAPPRASARR
jgi:hypothetical protein